MCVAVGHLYVCRSSDLKCARNVVVLVPQYQPQTTEDYSSCVLAIEVVGLLLRRSDGHTSQFLVNFTVIVFRRNSDATDRCLAWLSLL